MHIYIYIYRPPCGRKCRAPEGLNPVLGPFRPSECHATLILNSCTYETPTDLILYFKIIFCPFYDVICDLRVNAAELDITFHLMDSIAYDTPKNLILYSKLIFCPFYDVICGFRINEWQHTYIHTYIHHK